MNLYKIQEELKFKSIPELQHFANGMDPKVPAWMASAVLKAKVDEKQRWDNMQGAAQGQMPSIKEQLEQKAGLMQQQASQAPAGLAQAAMPAPKGPVQMPGGITSGNAGANMNFAEGGIVGFSEGGATKRIRYTNEGENLLPATTGYEGMDLWDAIKAMGGDFQKYLARTEKESLQQPKETVVIPENAPAPQSLSEGAVESALAAKPTTGLASAAPGAAGPRIPGAPGVATQRAPGAPAAPRPAPAGGLGSSSIAGMLQKQLGKEAAQPTTEDAIAAIKGIQKGFGVDTPAGKEEREMIAQMRAQREGQIKDRGMQNLITYLTNVRGSTIGEGLGRGAQMSQAEIARQNAADLANQEKMYEMVSALNKANRAEGVGAAKSAGELLAGREKTAGEADRARLQALANVYHTDIASAAQLEASRIMAAARSGQMDEKQQLAELKALQGSLQAQLKNMNQFDKAGRAPYEQQLAVINAEIAKMAGVSTMPSAPGAANAGGTPPPGAVREVKR